MKVYSAMSYRPSSGIVRPCVLSWCCVADLVPLWRYDSGLTPLPSSMDRTGVVAEILERNEGVLVPTSDPACLKLVAG